MKSTIGASILTGSLLASSLLVFGATAADAKAKHSPRLGPYGYGSVKLGMTAKKAKATGQVVKKMPGGGCSGWDLKKFRTPKDSIGIWLSPHVGLAAIFAAKGMKTPEGIKIGSTLKQVEAAYPRVKKDGHGYYTITVPHNKKAYYSFEIGHHKVKSYLIALKKQDCFN
jgi:hypothetical protein